MPDPSIPEPVKPDIIESSDWGRDRYELSAYDLAQIIYLRERPSNVSMEFNELSAEGQLPWFRIARQSLARPGTSVQALPDRRNAEKVTTGEIVEVTKEFQQTHEGFQKAKEFIEIEWSRTGLGGVGKKLDDARPIRQQLVKAYGLLEYLENHGHEDKDILGAAKKAAMKSLLAYIRAYNEAHAGVLVPVTHIGVGQMEYRTVDIEAASVLKVTKIRLKKS